MLCFCTNAITKTRDLLVSAVRQPLKCLPRSVIWTISQAWQGQSQLLSGEGMKARSEGLLACAVLGGYSCGSLPSLFFSPWLLLTVNKCSPGEATSQQVYQPQEIKDCEEEGAVQTPVPDPAGEKQDCCHCGLLELKCSLSQRKDETWLLVETPSLSTTVSHLQVAVTTFVLSSSSRSSDMTKSHPETIVKCTGAAQSIVETSFRSHKHIC